MELPIRERWAHTLYGVRATRSLLYCRFKVGYVRKRYLRSFCKDTALKSQITAPKTQCGVQSQRNTAPQIATGLQVRSKRNRRISSDFRK